MSAPSPSLKEIASRLQGLAGAKLPGLSQAADAAVKLFNAAPNVKSDQAEYNQLATIACQLSYGIAEKLRAQGQRNIDPKLKGDLDEVTGVLEKVLELAQASAARSDWAAFFYSDTDELKPFREQLEQRLSAFGVRDVPYKPNTLPQPNNDNRTRSDPETRPQPVSDNRTTTNNSGTFHGSNLSNINQGNHGTVNQGNNYKQEMFKDARDFKIHGGEFNNIGRDMNKTSSVKI
jgi:hypothetical protein